MVYRRELAPPRGRESPDVLRSGREGVWWERGDGLQVQVAAPEREAGRRAHALVAARDGARVRGRRALATLMSSPDERMNARSAVRRSLRTLVDRRAQRGTRGSRGRRDLVAAAGLPATRRKSRRRRHLQNRRSCVLCAARLTEIAGSPPSSGRRRTVTSRGKPGGIARRAPWRKRDSGNRRRSRRRSLRGSPCAAGQGCATPVAWRRRRRMAAPSCVRIERERGFAL